MKNRTTHQPSVWNWLFGGDTATAITDINPATGLPMLDDIGGVDIGGNPYGFDLNQSGDHGSPHFDNSFDIGASLGGDWPE